MKRLLFASVILMTTVVSSGIVMAKPFQPSDVTADARWILHLDLQAIRSSEVAQEIYPGRVEKHPFVRSFKEGRWKVNVDFRGEPRGITVYGTHLSRAQGVLFLYTEPGGSQPVADMPDLPGAETVSYHAYQLHAWTWRDEKQPSLALALPRNDLVVWAGSVDLLKSALDVLDGRSPGLDEQGALLGTDVPEGTMFLVGATRLEHIDLSDNAPLLENLKGFQYAEGAAGGQWFSILTALTTSAEVNRHLKSMVDGVISALWLFSGDKEEEQDEETRVEVSTDGQKITLRLNAPVDELVARFRNVWQWMYTAENQPEDSPPGEGSEDAAVGEKVEGKQDK